MFSSQAGLIKKKKVQPSASRGDEMLFLEAGGCYSQSGAGRMEPVLALLQLAGGHRKQNPSFSEALALAKLQLCSFPPGRVCGETSQ